MGTLETKTRYFQICQVSSRRISFYFFFNKRVIRVKTKPGIICLKKQNKAKTKIKTKQRQKQKNKTKQNKTNKEKRKTITKQNQKTKQNKNREYPQIISINEQMI